MSDWRISLRAALLALACTLAAIVALPAFPVGSPRVAPWVADATVTDVLVADAKTLGYPAVGATISSWAATKGSNPPNVLANDKFAANFDPSGRTSVQLNGTPSSYVAIDSLASGLNGTAKAFTFIISAQIPAAPTGSPIWYLWFVGSSTSNNPAIGIAGSTGNTTFALSRRNDTGPGSQFNSSAVSPGTSRFVFIAVYNGSQLTTRFNGAAVDTAISFGGGAMTGLNSFSLGVSRGLTGGGYSNPNIRTFVYAQSALSSGTYLAIEKYLLN